MTRQVTTDREASTRPTSIRSPQFTGREGELVALTQALAGQPAVVLIEGEAGIGKTRLVSEFLASLAGKQQRPLVAACPPLVHPHTLGPVTDALRRATLEIRRLTLSPLAGVLRPLFPDWTNMLPPALEVAGDSSAEQHRIFTALTDLLTGLQARLLVIEDAHWADEATLELLLSLATTAPRPTSLLVTCRPEEVPDGSPLRRLSRLACGQHGLRLTLTPLDVAQTRELVSSMLPGGQISEQFAAFMQVHTDGVPLAVEESVRLLGERDDIISRDGRWVRRALAEIAVPPTIRDAVLERTTRLTPDAQAVVQASAVLAVPAAEDTLTAVADLPLDQVRDGLGEALRCGLLSEVFVDDCALATFHHMLAARAVYEAIPTPQRRQLHHSAGLALEQLSPLPAAQLAHHFREAGDTPKWCRYAEQAADLALATGDESTAIALLHDLITRGGVAVPDAVRLVGKLPLILLQGSGQDQLVAALRRLLAAADLVPAAEAALRYQLARVLATLGEWNTAPAELEQAIPRLLEDSPAAAARAMLLLGWPYGATGSAFDHLCWLRRAAEVSVQVGPAERLLLEVNRVLALLLLGQEEAWAEAARLPEDAPAGGERLQLARGHLNIAEGAMLWGRYPEARQSLSRAEQLAQTSGYISLGKIAIAAQAQLDWLTGAWDRLPDKVGTLISNHALPRQERLLAHLLSAQHQAVKGTGTGAGHDLRLVYEEARCHGLVDSWVESGAALARLELDDGQADQALLITDELAGVIARKGLWLYAGRLAPVRVQAFIACGQLAEAGQLVEAFARWLEGRDIPAPSAALRLCWALLAKADGEHEHATSLFAQAEAAYAALPRPYDALLAREGQARCLLALHQSDKALELLTGLRESLITLGALSDAERVVATLRDHGVPVRRPQRGGRRTYGDQLSPRELEVVRLVLGGQTNPQIAQVLSRSPRTVTVQLASAMRKLGVSSRTAVAVAALQAGITPDNRTSTCR